jgi:hypothetical protein
MQNHFNSYGVFIVATMLQNILGTEAAFDEGTDILWEKSICIYEEFIKSEYNVNTKSEMDCIEEFMQQTNKPTKN